MCLTFFHTILPARLTLVNRLLWHAARHPQGPGQGCYLQPSGLEDHRNGSLFGQEAQKAGYTEASLHLGYEQIFLVWSGLTSGFKFLHGLLTNKNKNSGEKIKFGPAP